MKSYIGTCWVDEAALNQPCQRSLLSSAQYPISFITRSYHQC